MAATRTATTMILKEIVYCRLRLSFSSLSSSSLPSLRLTPTNLHANAVKFTRRELSFSRIRCAASDDKKVSARLSQVQQLQHPVLRSRFRVLVGMDHGPIFPNNK
ncbi:conserved hypothetical protein [Ricinus communis]|uniref:Uncharacterized protein n=1 Tax=Ricinus communis TaxID=3988 RepID=B9RBT2_RICCO|nr:conserved hypothetical protein [Ricinus communis]